MSGGVTVTRFAPSPTGYLHLGHAYSARFAHNAAQGGRFILRIEDIDPVRCKPEFADAIFEDLGWLGLMWEQPVRRQSEHMVDYAQPLQALRDKGVLYPCFCTRSDIAVAMDAPHQGPDGAIYPGTCRHLSQTQRDDKMGQGLAYSWRLDVAKVSAMTGPLSWHDHAAGEITARPQDFGDVVLARKDVPTSYHLSVTHDDHLQDITLVTRGKDLFRSTDIHRLLQALLGYKTPDYHHHDLLMDETGRRYAKRDKSVTIRSLREAGRTADDVWAMLEPTAHRHSISP